MSEKFKTIDVNKIQNQEELLEVCVILTEALEKEKQKIDDQSVMVQSLYDIIDQNDDVALDLADFIGYQFGVMNSAAMMIETALVNLEQMVASDMSADMHIREASMFVTLWYNLGLTHIDISSDCLIELNKVENDLRARIAEGEIEFDEDKLEVRMIN